MRHLDHAKMIELEAQARAPHILEHRDGEHGGMAHALALRCPQLDGSPRERPR
jgi:hypothetical protein